MAKIKALFVEYCAKDFLDGTQQLDPMAELAYRRICDMIYATDDALIDDDKVLQHSTKTGARWKSIKHELINKYGKIYVENGFIKQHVCTEKLEKIWGKIAQSSEAGKASAKKRKSLKNKETGSTGVEFSLPKNAQKQSTKRQPTKDPTTTIDISKDISIQTGQKNESGFQEFWDGWNPYDMTKGSRADALKNYIKTLKETDHETIIGKRNQYLEQCHRNRLKTKHAATWLSKRGWEDDYSAIIIVSDNSKGNSDDGTRNRVNETARFIDHLFQD